MVQGLSLFFLPFLQLHLQILTLCLTRPHFKMTEMTQSLQTCIYSKQMHLYLKCAVSDTCICCHAILRIPFHPAPGNLLVEIVPQICLTLLKSSFMHLAAAQCCFSKASFNYLGPAQ